jgi:hypothetical protein
MVLNLIERLRWHIAMAYANAGNGYGTNYQVSQLATYIVDFLVFF